MIVAIARNQTNLGGWRHSLGSIFRDGGSTTATNRSLNWRNEVVGSEK